MLKFSDFSTKINTISNNEDSSGVLKNRFHGMVYDVEAYIDLNNVA